MGYRRILLLLTCLAALAGWMRPASAEESTLHMGLESIGLFADPHPTSNLSTRNLMAHLYEGLVGRGPNLDLEPSLAVSWTERPDGGWQFDLRRDVQFHRGGRLEANDVIYSFCRILRMPASPLAATVRQFSTVEAIGTDRLIIRSQLASMDVPRQLVGIWIVDAPPGWTGRFNTASCGDGGALPPFTAAEQADGTGPYRLTRFQQGEKALLTRFPRYWGNRPPWNQVEIVQIEDTARRSRALAVGEVDVIDMVPAESAAYLRGRADIDLVVGPISRTFQMQMNQRPAAGGVVNPLTDARVRRALSLAIDRTAVIERTLTIGALPTSQLMPAGMDGYQPDLIDNPFDPSQARQYLREAGYADGFDTTILVQDYAARFAQAIARYLQQVGIRASVVTLDEGQLVKRISNGDFQLFIGSINLFAGDFVTLTRNLLASDKAPTGPGSYNRGGFSNAEADALIAQLQQQPPDAAGRSDLFRRLALLTSREAALIPLAHAGRTWAIRQGLRYGGRVDGLTLAMEIFPNHK